MKVVIVGATGALGKALALEEAKKKSELQLVASDLRDLEALKKDLEIRFGVRVSILAANLTDQSLAEGIFLMADRYYFPIGAISASDQWGMSPQQCREIFEVNFLSVSAIIAQVAAKKRSVDLVGFGSIAETRGRSKNVCYSAAKRALTSLFESLVHYSLQQESEQKLRPFLFQIGYMNSQMSFGKKLLLPVIEPDEVARRVVTLVDHGTPRIMYMPGFWRWLCLVLRYLPWKIYGKLKF